MATQKWTTAQIPALTGKTIVVTGGNSGLGYECVKTFAQKGAEVIMASRSIKNGKEAKAKIIAGDPSCKIVVMELDLMDLTSIKNFATAFKNHYSQLDVLMNNAGIMTTPYNKTKDGFESQIGTNHLGHFALTGLLLKILKLTPNSRIVTTSSMAHKQGTMDFSNLLFDKGKGYTPIKSYSRSKLANLLFTYELQRRLNAHNINTIAVAAHPGVAQTNLARHIDGKWWFKLMLPLLKVMTHDSAHGALPQIRAAVDHNVKGGEYYGPNGLYEMTGIPVLVKSNKASHSLIDAIKLWEKSEELVGITYNF